MSKKPWLKMWTSWLSDINMDRLSLAEQGAFWRLFSLCHDCGHVDGDEKLDGALVSAGMQLTLPDIMKSLKISEEVDKTTFLSMIRKMEAAGNLHWDGSTLYVTHYEESQRAASDTKEERARRQSEYRKSLKPQKNFEAPDVPTPPPIDNREYIKEERGKRCHGKRNEKSVTQAQAENDCNGKAVTRELFRCYERYIGLLNPNDVDRMKEFADFYENNEGLISWIEIGFKKAPANKRRWPYIQAILERYIEEGGPDGRTEEKPRRQGSRGQQYADNRGDPLQSARESGWDVIEDD